MDQLACSLKDRQATAEAIRQLGEDDLRFLNHIIVERLKLMAQARSTALMSRFNSGDRVKFQASSGEWKTGTVQKLNKKTATVITDDKQHWNISPGLLSPVWQGSRGQGKD